MIAGIGLDIVELERIAKLDAKSPKFRLRTLTDRRTGYLRIAYRPSPR